MVVVVVYLLLGSLGAHPDHILSGFLCLSLDFDDDGTLNREDLSHLVNCLTGQGEDTRLSASEMKQLIDNVSSWARPGSGREGQGLGLTLSLPQILEESDIDRDGTINLSEFQHVISRSPDFARYNGRGPPYSGCCTWVWDVSMGGGSQAEQSLQFLSVSQGSSNAEGEGQMWDSPF